MIDLGLRLADIERFGRWDAAPSRALSTCQARRGRGSTKRGRRREEAACATSNGATEAEIDFLLTRRRQHRPARRTERHDLRPVRRLRRAQADRAWLGKVVPAADMLAETYAAFKRRRMARQALEAELARLNAEPVDVPADLERVRAYLDEHPDGDVGRRRAGGLDEDEERVRAVRNATRPRTRKHASGPATDPLILPLASHGGTPLPRRTGPMRTGTARAFPQRGSSPWLRHWIAERCEEVAGFWSRSSDLFASWRE